MGPSDMGQVIALASLALALDYDMSSGACVYHRLYDTPEIMITRVTGRR